MRVRFFKQKGEDKYSVVVVTERGRIVHEKFDTYAEALKYCSTLPVRDLDLEEV